MDGIVPIIRQKLINSCNYDDSYFQFFMGMINLVPWMVSFAFMGIAAYTTEIFWPIMSGGGVVNWIVNYVLVGLILDPAPLPECGGKSALPAIIAQHAFFFLTYIQMAVIIYKIPRVKVVHIFLLQEWVSLAWASSIILGFNNTYQVIWGAMVGCLVALVFHLAVFFVMTTWYTEIMSSALVKLGGYEDTIFAPYTHISFDRDKMPDVAEAIAALRERTPPDQRDTQAYRDEMYALVHYVSTIGGVVAKDTIDADSLAMARRIMIDNGFLVFGPFPSLSGHTPHALFATCAYYGVLVVIVGGLVGQLSRLMKPS